MATIATILLEGRKRKGLTQLEVAQRLGFKSMDRISKWEHGASEPGAKNLMKLLELYEIPTQQVLEAFSDEMHGDSSAHSGAHPAFATPVEAFNLDR